MLSVFFPTGAAMVTNNMPLGGYDVSQADSLSVDLCCSVYLRSQGWWCRAPGQPQYPTPCLWDWSPAAYWGPLQSFAGRLSLTDDCALHHSWSLALEERGQRNSFMNVCERERSRPSVNSHLWGIYRCPWPNSQRSELPRQQHRLTVYGRSKSEFVVIFCERMHEYEHH